jgi:hypothetical protein
MCRAAFPYHSASAASFAKNGFHGKSRSTMSSRATGAQLCASWRKLLAPVPSCGTPWNSADNGDAVTQSQLAIAWLAGAISPPNLFHPWRRGHRRTRLRCRHPKRPRTRQRRPASQSCGSSSQLGHQRPLDLVRCPVLRITTESCGTHPQRQPTDDNLHQTQSLPRATPCSAKPSSVSSRALRQLHLRQLADHN